MGSKWSSSMESTRPPNESSRFILEGARRVFASSTNTCFLSGRHLCFSHRSHPGCLDRELVEAMSEAFFGWELWLSPPDGLWRDGIVFVAKHIREKSRCKKRICNVYDYAYLLTTSLFLSECIWVTPLLGVTNFVSLYQPLGCPLCSRDRVVKPLRSLYFLCFGM